MKKNLVELLDELIITHCKIFSLVDKVQADKHTREDAKKLQDLNNYRSKLKNAIGEEFGLSKEVKI